MQRCHVVRELLFFEWNLTLTTFKCGTHGEIDAIQHTRCTINVENKYANSTYYSITSWDKTPCDNPYLIVRRRFYPVLEQGAFEENAHLVFIGSVQMVHTIGFKA